MKNENRPVAPELKKELGKRLANYRAGKSRRITISELKRRVFAKIPNS